ncbi:MAG: hypothetical protein JNL88_04315 [Bacteroidia bacterium]|nr:hypothetical protein [Bacteroidia bacterium]
MKTNLQIMDVVISCSMLLIAFQAHAQFTPPANPDNFYGVNPSQGRNTGNDVLSFSGDNYWVSVWETAGCTEAFGWEADYNGNTYSGNEVLSYTSGVGDPDVCLVTKTGSPSIFAFVTYYHTPSTSWYMDYFIFNTSTNQFELQNGPYQLATGSFGRTINIDGNEKSDGEFAIVWDDSGGNLYVTTGDASSFVLNNALNLPNGGWYPDLSLFYDGNDDIVHITYLTDNGDLYVDDYDFSDLASGGTSSRNNVLLVSPTSAYDHYYPRIACPSGLNGSGTQWTVVVMENNGTNSYYIKGYNDGSTTPIYYNDASNQPGSDISVATNYYPSVAYDSNFPSDGIWVGWNMDNTSPAYPFGTITNILEADYAIVLKCDNTAIPVSTATYLQVPDGVTSNNADLSGFLSLAGRFHTGDLFATYMAVIQNGSTADDVCYKKVSGGVFRYGLFNNIDESKINTLSLQALFDKGTYPMEVMVYSMMGQKLLNTTIRSKTEADLLMNEQSKNLRSLTVWRIFNSEGLSSFIKTVY